MKNPTKFITVFIVFILTIPAYMNAQITKGTFRIGPTLDFSSGSTEIDGFDVEIKNTDMQIGLSFGYYFIDNFEGGISVGYIFQKDEVDNFESTSTGVVVGPHLEYNVGLSSQFYLPIGGAFGYNSLNNEDDNGNEATFSGISFAFWTGIEFISNNKLGAELLIGPQFGTLKDDDSDSEFDVTTISARIGIHFYF